MEVIRLVDDLEKLEITLDTSLYRPDQLRVTVTGGTIVVEGEHEVKDDQGEILTTRRFTRRYHQHEEFSHR